MLDKIKELLGSVRFWGVTAGALSQVLAFFGALDTELANILTGYFGVVITIGSVDSIATKFGAALRGKK